MPAPDQNGIAYDGLDFKVHDGSEYSVSAYTMTVDVTPVQDAPTEALVGGFETVPPPQGATAWTLRN